MALFNKPVNKKAVSEIAFKQPRLFENEHGNQLFAGDKQASLDSFFKFARERHAIYLRRAAGLPKPWTNDWVLRNHRFCNIYRELDTVSEWISNNIIKPYEDNPNLWFMLCVARYINWPDTLQALMDGGAWPEKTWNADKAFNIMNAIFKGDGKKKGKIFTGAYLINAAGAKKLPKGESTKARHVVDVPLQTAWDYRKEIAPTMKASMQEARDALASVQGIGAFMAYQIIVDLSYSKKWLGKAKDINTFTSPGPGTCRGISRVFYDVEFQPLPDAKRNEHMLELWHAANDSNKYWPNDATDPRKGYAPLSMSNCLNLNCEFDKYCRVIRGEGKTRSRYPGSM
jgi:hypothetical protein